MRVESNSGRRVAPHIIEKRSFFVFIAPFTRMDCGYFFVLRPWFSRLRRIAFSPYCDRFTTSRQFAFPCSRAWLVRWPPRHPFVRHAKPHAPLYQCFRVSEDGFSIPLHQAFYDGAVVVGCVCTESIGRISHHSIHAFQCRRDGQRIPEIQRHAATRRGITMTCMQRRERRCWNRGCRVGVHEVKRSPYRMGIPTAPCRRWIAWRSGRGYSTPCRCSS
jgi:hypothetical protein